MSKRLRILSLVLLSALAAAGARAEYERHHNLYGWMAIAPIVVTAVVHEDDPRTPLMQVLRVARGDLTPESVIEVDVRQANLERGDLQKKLRLDPGKYYLLLLEPPPIVNEDEPEPYRLVRGIKGAREIPREGWTLYADATERFAAIQATESQTMIWLALEGLLEETSHLLVGTALEQYIKFRRGGPETLPLLRPLLDHPREDLRELTIRLVGMILERYPGEEVEERETIEAELIALARRDPSAELRAVATESLRGLRTVPLAEILDEISRSDPEQEVRFVAEKLLYEMGLDPEERRAPPDGSR